MKNMAAVLFVRVKSGLDPRELERRVLERKPRFLDVAGLRSRSFVRAS